MHVPGDGAPIQGFLPVEVVSGCVFALPLYTLGVRGRGSSTVPRSVSKERMDCHHSKRHGTAVGRNPEALNGRCNGLMHTMKIHKPTGLHVAQKALLDPRTENNNRP